MSGVSLLQLKVESRDSHSNTLDANYCRLLDATLPPRSGQRGSGFWNFFGLRRLLGSFSLRGIGMRTFFIAAGVCLALSGHTPAYGQAGALFDAFQVDASLPLQFSTNTLLTPTNARSDFWSSPSLKLTALGSLELHLDVPDLFFQQSGTATGGSTRRKTPPRLLERGSTRRSTTASAAGGILRTYVRVQRRLPIDRVSGQRLCRVRRLHDTWTRRRASLSRRPSRRTYRLPTMYRKTGLCLYLKATIIQQLTQKWSCCVTPVLRVLRLH